MHWTTWCLIAIIVYIACLPIALGFMRGAAILNKRLEREPDEPDEPERGLTL